MSNLHKRQVHAGLMEIIRDSKYYYSSQVDSGYNKFTDEGMKVLIEYVTYMAPLMLQKEKDDLNALAKQIVWGELKK